MPTASLLPADPLPPRAVDEHFASPATVVERGCGLETAFFAREAGGQVALIDHEALVQGRTNASVRRPTVPIGFSQPPSVSVSPHRLQSTLSASVSEV
jgi:hypothetical protein